MTKKYTRTIDLVAGITQPIPAKLVKPEDYTFGPEDEAKIPAWVNLWRANNLATGPYTQDELDIVYEAITNLYAVAKTPEPPPCRRVRSPSSVCTSFVAGIAASVWVLRTDGQAMGDYLEGRVLTDAEIVRYAAMWANWCDLKYYGPLQTAEKKNWIFELTEQCIRTEDNMTPFAGMEKLDYYADYSETDTKEFRELLASFFRQMIEKCHDIKNGGNHWSGYACFYTFFRYVVGMDLDYSEWDAYEQAVRGSARFMDNNFWILSDRATSLVYDGDHPSNPHGPSHVWRDGTEMYYYANTKVPPEWVKRQNDFDLASMYKAAVENNADAAKLLLELVARSETREEVANHAALLLARDYPSC